MIIVRGDVLVNFDNVFSIKIGGQGQRYMIIRGADSLSAEMVFPGNKEAKQAREMMIKAAINDELFLDLDVL